ncbi:MAG: flippase [Terriglobales bacterium]
MISDLKRLTKNSGIYAAGQILGKAVGFFMLPVYTRYLNPRDYGVLSLLDTVMFFATIFAGMGVQTALMRFYALYEPEHDKKEVVGTAILFFSLTSAAMGAVLSLTAPWIAQSVLGDRTMAPLVRIVSLTFIFGNLCEVPMTYWRVRERAAWYVGINLAKTVVGMLSLIVSLAVLRQGLVGALYANLFTSFLFAGVLLAFAFREVPACLVVSKLKPMIRFGAPLIITGLGSFVLVFSDRFFLRYYAGLEEVGVYALGYKLASIVVLLVTLPFSMGWQWQQFDLAKRGNAAELYAKIQTYLWFVSVFCALGVSVLARDVLPFLAPPAYAQAASVVPLIALSYVLVNARTVIQSELYVKGATQRAALVAVIVTAANLTLNYLLIPRYLVMGAAMATVASYGLSLVLTSVVAHKLNPVPYEYGRNGLALAAAGVAYFLAQAHHLPLPVSVAANVGLVGLFGVIMLRLLDQEERQMFWKLGLSLAETLRRTALRQ